MTPVVRRRLLFAWVALVLTWGALWGGSILRKGQVIKQFHTSSITTSLARENFDILATSLPCPDPQGLNESRGWAEEIPVFHALGALLIKLGITDPQWPSLLSVFVWALAFYAVFTHFSLNLEGALLVLFAPVLIRYLPQHLPDVWAAALLTWGFAFALRRRKGEALVAWFVAGLIKPLALLPAVFIAFATWGWGVAVGFGAVSALVFGAWLYTLQTHQIPNPFFFASGLENRHSGAWSYLWDPHYYARLATWVGTKGVGWIVVGLSFYGFRLDRQVAAWGLAAVASWVLVRAGSSIHDYYFLMYFPAFAIAGALGLRESPWKRFGWVLVVATVLTGLDQPVSLDRGAYSEAPNFCDAETGGVSKL